MRFMSDDFLLTTPAARRLYHEHAAHMPIFDFHCHLNPRDIADDKRYRSITEVWLGGDHYKWRAMRSNGVPERFITGDAGDWEKFERWADTIQHAMRNPLYHWTHLELQRVFGIYDVLSPKTAKKIFDTCNAIIAEPWFSARGIMKQFKVAGVCTTDDPVDSLEHHRKIKSDGFSSAVLPTFRPDKAMAVENPELFNDWVVKLEAAVNCSIGTFQQFLDAFKKRHLFFHEMGCRVSDHGMEYVTFLPVSDNDMPDIFAKVRAGAYLTHDEIAKFKTGMLRECGHLNHDHGWIMQLHLGAIRNNNTLMFRALGPDTGFDSIGDASVAKDLSRFLDSLALEHSLPRTILYNLNSKDNKVLGSMLGNFQDGSIPGKIQFGSAWWFLDTKKGMEEQIDALSELGLLSRFVGMLTDSRSFLSYPRHEYFRRILCNKIGVEVDAGELPADWESLGAMIGDISYTNAKNYFGIPLVF
ncbi:MAG: glucuronate isomerase [Spirochaetota bacterium]